MIFPKSFLLLALPLLATAAPVKRQDAAAADPNVIVLQLAVALEQLEAEFYEAALTRFTAADFAAAGIAEGDAVIEQVQAVALAERTHFNVLSGVLTSLSGITQVCTLDFEATLADARTFVQTARVFETLGVTAYSGAASLVTNKDILTSAAQILTTEAVHTGFFNLVNGGVYEPFAFTHFLDAVSVVTLAAPFITGGCTLPIAPRTALTITNQGAIQPGTALTFNVDPQGVFCHFLIPGAPTTVVADGLNCIVPAEVQGFHAVFLASESTALPLTIDSLSTTQFVAGPAVFTADTQQDLVSALIVQGGGINGAANFAGGVGAENIEAGLGGVQVLPPGFDPAALNAGGIDFGGVQGFDGQTQIIINEIDTILGGFGLPSLSSVAGHLGFNSNSFGKWLGANGFFPTSKGFGHHSGSSSTTTIITPGEASNIISGGFSSGGDSFPLGSGGESIILPTPSLPVPSSGADLSLPVPSSGADLSLPVPSAGPELLPPVESSGLDAFGSDGAALPAPTSGALLDLPEPIAAESNSAPPPSGEIVQVEAIGGEGAAAAPSVLAADVTVLGMEGGVVA